ncbi:hypothetical protein SteCoe_1196 [Stentor coeruleus]|uniref:RING-type domain-containing protein n=1 Tax=Stentor coeruleus TaxID=5963 RepID=A0A1R2D2H1_9CILI|nr:hypothetical protein SteCoe_1196 [Stentor coeruleus]
MNFEDTFKIFWCHSCRSHILLNINIPNLCCIRCRSELIEEIESIDQHPSQFIPQGLEPRISQTFNLRSIYIIQVITSSIANRGAPPASNNDINSLEIVNDSEEDCPICQDSLESNCRRMRCGHVYHFSCLRPWLRMHNTCPVCRVSLS